MPDVTLTINGKDKASGAIKGVTGSIIKAQLATELLKSASRALVDITKQSIEAFRVQEQAEAKLAAATETNIDGFKKFASELQAVTTVGDEAILQAQQLGSAMGIQNDQLNQAAQDAVGLSKALGTDLNAAMKLTALASQGNFDALSRYLPALKEATTEAEKNAIVQEAMAKGFRIAQAEADTFTGKLQQLENARGDTLEGFGQLVSLIGESYVDAMVDGTSAMNEFLAEAENIASIVAGFEVFKQVAWATIEPIIDMASAVIETGKAVGAFFSLLKKDISLKEFNQQMADTAQAQLDVINNMISNVTSLDDVYEETFNRITKNFDKTNKQMSNGADDTVQKQEDAAEKTESAWQETFSSLASAATQVTGVMSEAFDTFFSNQQVALDSSLASQLEAIDANTQAQLEQLGLVEETKVEKLNREIAELQNALTRETDLGAKAELQKTINEKQNEAQRTQIVEANEKQKEAAKLKAAKKEHQLNVDIFNAKKAIDIANVGISMSTGIVSAWASGAGWPGPSLVAGMALAGVLSGIITAAGAASIGVIASKQPPAPTFKDGGIVPGVSFSGDNVIARVNSGELILNQAQQDNVADQLTGGGGININGPITIVANDPEAFIEQLTELQRFEAART